MIIGASFTGLEMLKSAILISVVQWYKMFTGIKHCKKNALLANFDYMSSHTDLSFLSRHILCLKQGPRTYEVSPSPFLIEALISNIPSNGQRTENEKSDISGRGCFFPVLILLLMSSGSLFPKNKNVQNLLTCTPLFQKEPNQQNY